MIFLLLAGLAGIVFTLWKVWRHRAGLKSLLAANFSAALVCGAAVVIAIVWAFSTRYYVTKSGSQVIIVDRWFGSSHR